MACTASRDSFQLPGHGGGAYTPFDKKTPPVSLGIRPEHIAVVTDGEGHCRGHVEIAEYLGADTLLYIHCDGLGVITVRGAGEDEQRFGVAAHARRDVIDLVEAGELVGVALVLLECGQPLEEPVDEALVPTAEVDEHVGNDPS